MKPFQFSRNTAAWLAALALLYQGAAAAQPNPRQWNTPFVRATGEATVTAQPDQARIDIGVVSQAANAHVAAAENSKQLEAVIQELRRELGHTANITTTSYSLYPNYHYPRESGQPTIVGYTAKNVIRVTIDDLAGVGRVIDAATHAGANNIELLQFTLKNEQPVRARALRDATIQARANAEAIAAGLGLRLGPVLAAEQGTASVVQPLRQTLMAAPQAAAIRTPVEPGTIEVRATITLDVGLGR